MPAILRAREAARIAQCTNNQHNLSSAIHQYDLSKQPSHYPGYRNQAGTVTVGWVPVLLPFLAAWIYGRHVGRVRLAHRGRAGAVIG